MDEETKKNIADKKWFGERVVAFLESKGKSIAELQELTGLTNLKAIKRGVIPQWDKLMKAVHSSGGDIVELVEFLVPGEIHSLDKVEIEAGSDLAAHKMLNTVLKCRTNRRRIHGITINLEEFSTAAEREMGAGQKEKVKADLKEVKARDGPVRK